MIDIQGIRSLVGRPLREPEERHIEWINGWGQETRESFFDLVKSAYWNGANEGVKTAKRAPAPEMSHQDVKEFAEALAVRYKQTMDDYHKARDEHTAAAAKINSQQNLHQSYMRQEQAYARYSLFVETLDTLPIKIQQPFYEHLKSIE